MSKAAHSNTEGQAEQSQPSEMLNGRIEELEIILAEKQGYFQQLQGEMVKTEREIISIQGGLAELQRLETTEKGE